MGSIYEQSVPLYMKWIGNASTILDKAETWAKENGKTDADVLGARIYADMQPFTFQAYTMVDQAWKNANRCLGAPEFQITPHAELKSLADVKQLFNQAIEYLKAVPANSGDGKADENVQLKLPFGTFDMTAQKYTQQFALSNFYFHYSTFYNILRMLGVPLGKADFLANVLS